MSGVKRLVDAGEGVVASERQHDLLDEVLDASVAHESGRSAHAAHAMALPLVGEVVEDRHECLTGRVKVRITSASGTSEQWMPTLHRMSIRTHDRVLVQRAANFPEPIVVGVIDGFDRRPELPPTAVKALPLQPDESVEVHAADGTPLLELRGGPDGPVVRLLTLDAAVELPGALRVSARSIELSAREGNLEIDSTQDVNVRGETINLN